MISGILDFDSVAGMRTRIFRHLRRHGRIVVDLSQTEKSNSAALALLLQWVEDAIDLGAHIRFRNLPPQLQDIADLYSVTSLLPLTD